MIYFDLFLTFFKIGAFTFGGGYAMLPLIKEEVLAHKWLTTDQMLDFIAVSESTPGPFAVNISTYVGSKTGGFFGAVCSTSGIVLPSFIIILIVAAFFRSFKQSSIVEGVMTGLRPCVIGLIGAAVISLAGSVFFTSPNCAGIVLDTRFFCSISIFAAMLVLLFKKVNPIIIILMSAAAGIACGYAFGL